MIRRRFRSFAGAGKIQQEFIIYQRAHSRRPPAVCLRRNESYELHSQPVPMSDKLYFVPTRQNKVNRKLLAFAIINNYVQLLWAVNANRKGQLDVCGA